MSVPAEQHEQPECLDESVPVRIDGPAAAALHDVTTDRDKQQEEAFTQWYNKYSGENNQVDSVATGLRTGAGLLNLLATLGSNPLRSKFTERPRNDIECLDNLEVAMEYMLESERIKLVGIGAKNLFDGDRKLVLGLMYTLIIKYEVKRYSRDVRDLLRWVQEHCVAYAHRERAVLPPQNFTTDMRDGVALACVLHAHFEDLIDIDAMHFHMERGDTAALLDNNEILAAALERIGVPRMIEPSAMVVAPPDEKTQIAVVGVMRHALEQERERRETEQLRLRREHAAALELAQQQAKAEEARHRRLAQQEKEEEAKAREEAAAAKAKAEAEEAAAAIEAERIAREEEQAAHRAAAAEELSARKAAEEAQRKAEEALRARGVEGCWLYKQSPKSYETFFKRWFVYDENAEGGTLRYYKNRELKDGKTVDLSEIVDVRLEFDDPTLMLGGRSTLLNFQFTDNKNNIVYRMSAEEGKSNILDLEGRETDCVAAAEPEQETAPKVLHSTSSETRLIGSTCVDMWLSIIRHHVLADDAPRTEHSKPPTGSLHLPERVAAQEKVAALRHVMSSPALQNVSHDTLVGADDTVPAAAMEQLDGPGELEDGVEWEDVADGVYLLIEHAQTKREGHTFKFRLRVTAKEKRVDFQMDFSGSINMRILGAGTVAESHLCRVEVRSGETKEVCVCRTIDAKKKANLSYETAVAEFLLTVDDSDDD